MTSTAEVVVYAATSAGVCAAVAAEAGAGVVLIEPGRHVGGMTSGGLGYTDVGDVRVLGGMAARFRHDVAEHYGVPAGTYAGPEPRVAEAVFRRWLGHPRIELITDCPLRSAELRDGRIVRITAADGRSFGGGVFIDASYEGDLLALAGVPHEVGREDRGTYGERWAGARSCSPAGTPCRRSSRRSPATRPVTTRVRCWRSCARVRSPRSARATAASWPTATGSA